MKRPVLIALAVLVPLALFVPAKIAASWRPVAIGKIARSQKRYQLALVRASERYVVAGIFN